MIRGGEGLCVWDPGPRALPWATVSRPFRAEGQLSVRGVSSDKGWDTISSDFGEACPYRRGGPLKPGSIAAISTRKLTVSAVG
jgi:hypothetical protein